MTPDQDSADLPPPPASSQPVRYKRTRGPQSNAATEMRSLQQIHTALASLPTMEAKSRILKSACSMAQLDILTLVNGVPTVSNRGT